MKGIDRLVKGERLDNPVWQAEKSVEDGPGDKERKKVGHERKDEDRPV